MPRTARIVVPDAPHHVTQRGNNRQDVFFVDADRRAYLALLREQCAAHAVRVLGYCLMTNHVHLVLVPPDEAALAAAVGRTHWHYTQYVNRLHGRSGHLWQNRFCSCALDEPHLWAALRYIECNPLRARLVRAAWRYPWSSAAAHAELSQNGAPGGTNGAAAADGAAGLLDLAVWRREWDPARWRQALAEPLPAGELTRLRRHLHTGRPLASDRRLARLEVALRRRLRALPVGRPKKELRIGGRS